jgi:hypothetical protein
VSSPASAHLHSLLRTSCPLICHRQRSFRFESFKLS